MSRAHAQKRIKELEAEVGHLREELGKIKQRPQAWVSHSSQDVFVAGVDQSNSDYVEDLGSIAGWNRGTGSLGAKTSTPLAGTPRSLGGTTAFDPAGLSVTSNIHQPQIYSPQSGLNLPAIHFSHLNDSEAPPMPDIDIFNAYFSHDAWSELSGNFDPIIEVRNLVGGASGSSDSDQTSSGIWRILPNHVDPTCRLDEVIMHEKMRSRLPGSQQVDTEFSSSAFPSVQSLLNPSNEDDLNPVSSAVGKHAALSTGLAFPEKLGWHYLMSVYLRWLSLPSCLHYEALPAFLRPTETQRSTPHPPWVDLVFWPLARDNIINEMDWSDFELLRKLCNAGLSLNWPETPSKALIIAPDNRIALSPLFLHHVHDLGNWSVDSTVIEVFPFMRDVQTHTERRRRIHSS